MKTKLGWGIFILFGGYLSAQEEEIINVKNVYFSGNEHLKDSQLRKVINLQSATFFSKMRFDKRILRLDAITVKNYYQQEGYLQASVRDLFNIGDNGADIHFIIGEGSRTYVQEVHVAGNDLVSSKSIINLLKLRVDHPFNPVALKTNMRLVEDRYHRQGKLFAEIKVEKIIKDSATINIQVNEGPDVYIDNIFIAGADSIFHRYVKRECTFTMGQIYDLDEMDRSQRRLLETSQFSYVNLFPVKKVENDSTVNVVVELRYFPKREISSEGGFVPIEVGGLTLSGPGVFIQWKNRSLFGTTTRISAKSSLELPTEEGLRYPRFNFNLNLENQWFLGLRFPTRVQTIYEIYKKYGASDDPYIQHYGLRWSTINRFTDTSFLEFGMRWEQFSRQSDIIQNVEQRIVSLKSKLDNTDDPLYPTKGYIITGDLYSAGKILGGSRDYQKFDSGLQSYILLPFKSIFALRIKYGMIFNWDSEYDVYEEVLFEKFYLGGTKTLRGWSALQFPVDQDISVIYLNGKEKRLLTNVEIRFPIFKSIGGEIFMDGGQLWDGDQNVSLEDLKWNSGVGITYASPLGPIRLDYAYQNDNPDQWEVLLDVLYAF